MQGSEQLQTKIRLNEVFCSIQGEGARVGSAATFIRFAGCNLRCDFCDTDYTEKMVMNVGELLQAAGELGVPNVVITGGEPAVQMKALGHLIRHLHFQRFHVAVETNGTVSFRSLLASPLAFPDWITVSPKSTQPLAQRGGNEVKLLWGGPGGLPHLYQSMGFNHFFLQPIERNGIYEGVDGIVEYVKRHPPWRLSLQIHKIIGVM